jgi:hypothetical protein
VLSELLEAQEKVLGPEHPDTLLTRHELASAHVKLGDHELGCQLFEELLPVRARVLEPNHDRVLRSRSRLALTLTKLNRLDEAIQIHREVTAIATSEFGALDLRTVQFQVAYAETLGQSDDPAAARDLDAFAVEQLTLQRGPYDKTP